MNGNMIPQKFFEIGHHEMKPKLWEVQSMKMSFWVNPRRPHERGGSFVGPQLSLKVVHILPFSTGCFNCSTVGTTLILCCGGLSCVLWSV